MAIKTYYDTLQVSRSASAAVIKAAYRTLSQKFHPDKNPENVAKALENMKRINEAYECLSDASRRAAYDQLVRDAEAQEAQRSNQAHQAWQSQATRPQAEPPPVPPRPSRPHVDKEAEEMAARARRAAADRAREYSSQSASKPWQPTEGAAKKSGFNWSALGVLGLVAAVIGGVIAFEQVQKSQQQRHQYIQQSQQRQQIEAERTRVVSKFPRCAGSYEVAKCEALEEALARETAQEAKARAKKAEDERAKAMRQVAVTPPKVARRKDPNCPSRVTLRLNSSGYTGLIDVELRQGTRPGSVFLEGSSVQTTGTVVLTNVCPGTYFFAFATPDSDQVSTTRYFDITNDYNGYSNPEITVTYSRNLEGGQRVGSAKRTQL